MADKPFDELNRLASCYEALAALVSEHEPAWVLLENLNDQLRAFVDALDDQGLIT